MSKLESFGSGCDYSQDLQEVLNKALGNAGVIRVAAALAKLATDTVSIPQVPFNLYSLGTDHAIHECVVYAELRDGNHRKFKGIVDSSDLVEISAERVGYTHFLTRREMECLLQEIRKYDSLEG